MEENIRVYIERLKAGLGVKTDEELGGKLGYSKQTIASWRRREKLPLDAEFRIVDRLGPQYAYSNMVRGFASMREDEVVYAAALFACEHFTSRLEKPLSLEMRRSLGYLFPEVVNAIRRKVKRAGFELENSLTMIEIFMALIMTNRLPEVSDILERALPNNRASGNAKSSE